jgi:carboxymethylenebutenolidase
VSRISTSNVLCGDMPALVVTPEGGTPAPCVIVMHERYGFVRHTKELAERFARDGFVAIAPDFYFRHPDQEALHRGDVGCDMSDGEAVAALEAAIDTLGTLVGADPTRVAVMGICQTGRYPLVLAASRPIGAALVWYGAAQPREWVVGRQYPRPLEEIIAAVNCPVLGIFGETDHLISLDDVRRFRDCFERRGKSFRIRVFADAPHGWLNDTMPGRYRRSQAEAAWAEQRDFLDAVLAPGYDRSLRVQSYRAEFSADYDFTSNIRQE